MTRLEVSGLRAGVEGNEILRGLDVVVESGQVHAIMGPNGSGKSTLSHVIMGRPGYEVLGGSVTLDGEDVLAMAPWQRAQAGLFLAMQYPTEIDGVQLSNVLTQSALAGGREPAELIARMETEADALQVPADLLARGLNVDMSGGEKKRSETLQLAALQPRIAILDEIDAGLDGDGLRMVSRRIERATQEDDLGVLVITHYNRLLEELHPDVVHVFVDGVIQESGGPELATELEETGYDRWIKPIETGVSIGGLGGLGGIGGEDPFADPLA
ncbi:MAG: Fe-S cluster assembly ATPase SufC [Acidimicrobiales bacterium]